MSNLGSHQSNNLQPQRYNMSKSGQRLQEAALLQAMDKMKQSLQKAPQRQEDNRDIENQVAERVKEPSIGAVGSGVLLENPERVSNYNLASSAAVSRIAGTKRALLGAEGPKPILEDTSSGSSEPAKEVSAARIQQENPQMKKRRRSLADVIADLEKNAASSSTEAVQVAEVAQDQMASSSSSTSTANINTPMSSTDVPRTIADALRDLLHEDRPQNVEKKKKDEPASDVVQRSSTSCVEASHVDKVQTARRSAMVLTSAGQLSRPVDEDLLQLGRQGLHQQKETGESGGRPTPKTARPAVDEDLLQLVRERVGESGRRRTWKNNTHFCQKCAAHGDDQVPVKGHVCPFKGCKCDRGCDVIEERNRKTRLDYHRKNGTLLKHLRSHPEDSDQVPQE